MADPDVDDIDAWVANLSRQANQGDRAAQALGRAIESHAAKRESELLTAIAGDDQAWQRMRFRLRRERLVGPGGPTWRTWMPLSAAAALALALAIPMFMAAPDFPVSAGDPPVMRGAPGTEFVVADPLAAAQKAARLLRKHDPKLRLYFSQGVATLDFEVDGPSGASVVKELKNEFPDSKPQFGFNRWVFRRAA